jgi:hypothetical protein
MCYLSGFLADCPNLKRDDFAAGELIGWGACANFCVDAIPEIEQIASWIGMPQAHDMARFSAHGSSQFQPVTFTPWDRS